MKARIIVGPPADCWKCGAMSTRMRVANTHGGYNVTEWCLHCDSSAVRNRAWVPTRGLTSINDLPIKQPRQGYYRDEHLCTVCGEMGLLECHHLAPWAQFGAAADRWPTVMVCRPCHEEWHRRMGQPIGNHSTTSNSSEAR